MEAVTVKIVCDNEELATPAGLAQLMHEIAKVHLNRSNMLPVDYLSALEILTTGALLGISRAEEATSEQALNVFLDHVRERMRRIEKGLADDDELSDAVKNCRN